MSKWDAATAEWYADNYGDYPTNRLAVDRLAFPSSPLVVDVGCGTGAALRHAASKCRSGTFVGVDPVPRMIEIARERTVGHPFESLIEYRLGAASELPVASGSAQYVLAFDSVDHWGDVEAGLREIRRILRADGRLAIVKDGGVPGASEARRMLSAAVTKAGLEEESVESVHEDGIRFTLWVCAGVSAT